MASAINPKENTAAQAATLKVPAAGERLQWEHLQIEVVDMDGQRIDKLLVVENPSPPQQET